MNKKFVITCVVDKHPRFYVELVLWAHCVRDYLPFDSFDPIVYFVEDNDEDIQKNQEIKNWLDCMGIASKSIESVVIGSPHSNKIAPYLDNPQGEYLIVTDVDLYFVADPSCLFMNKNIRAAPNNHCNPPGRIFRNIFMASGIGRSYRPGLALYAGGNGIRETHINNISAGITSISSDRAFAFGQRWLAWAKWLVNNIHLLERWGGHVDQVSFCLAVEDFSEDVDFLPAQVNTILHSLSEIESVFAMHLTTGHLPKFKHLFLQDGLIVDDKFSDDVNKAIARLNVCIAKAKFDITLLNSTKEYSHMFMNPDWKR